MKASTENGSEARDLIGGRENNPTWSRRTTLQGLASLLVPAAPVAFGQPAAYPNQSVSVLVGYPAGGQSDVIARSVVAGLQKVLGQTFIIENVPGAGGSLGAQRFLSARQDGYTLFAGTPIELIQTPMAMRVKYQSEDFRLIAPFGNSHMLLLVRAGLEVNSVAELVALARKQPGGLSFGSVGRGSGFHLAAEKFASDVGVSLLHVPYKGVAPLMTDLAGGQIDMAFMVLGGPTLGMIRTGKIKALGFASPRRHPDLPDVPTMDETGTVKNFVFDLWLGVLVSKTTPNEVAKRLSAAVRDVLAQPQFKRDLEATGVNVSNPMSLEEAARFYAADIERYRAIGKSIKLQPE